MDHVAIMDPRQGLISRILAGEKTIESRWYRSRVAPWNRLSAGDTIYFKNAGKLIIAAAQVRVVQQFDHPTTEELRRLIAERGGCPGICGMMAPDEWLAWAQPRPYVILAFLESPRAVSPFAIDKTGFGSAAAWLCIDDIRHRKRPLPLP